MREIESSRSRDRLGAESSGDRRRHVLRAGERWLRKAGLRLIVYVIAAYLVVKLIPSLRQALEDLERPSWGWLAVVAALEILSETGFVISWHRGRRSGEPPRS